MNRGSTSHGSSGPPALKPPCRCPCAVAVGTRHGDVVPLIQERHAGIGFIAPRLRAFGGPSDAKDQGLPSTLRLQNPLLNVGCAPMHQVLRMPEGI